MTAAISRRSVLGNVGAVVLGVTAGCVLFDDHAEVFLFNARRNRQVTASISVRRLDRDATVLSRTIELEADEDREWHLDLPLVPLRTDTETRDGLADSIEWTPGEEGCCLEIRFADEAIRQSVRAY